MKSKVWKWRIPPIFSQMSMLLRYFPGYCRKSVMEGKDWKLFSLLKVRLFLPKQLQCSSRRDKISIILSTCFKALRFRIKKLSLRHTQS